MLYLKVRSLIYRAIHSHSMLFDPGNETSGSHYIFMDSYLFSIFFYSVSVECSLWEKTNLIQLVLFGKVQMIFISKTRNSSYCYLLNLAISK